MTVHAASGQSASGQAPAGARPGGGSSGCGSRAARAARPGSRDRADLLAVEEPLEIRIGGQPLA